MATLEDYVDLARASGFRLLFAEDISEQTKKTWDICSDLVNVKSIWAAASELGASDVLPFLK